MRSLEHRWADALRFLELVLATPLLVVAMIQSPIHWGILILALLLAGVISVDTVAAWLHRTPPEPDETPPP